MALHLELMYLLYLNNLYKLNLLLRQLTWHSYLISLRLYYSLQNACTKFKAQCLSPANSLFYFILLYLKLFFYINGKLHLYD